MTADKCVTEQCVGIVLEFFEGDWKKTRLWFLTENPMFGGVPPGCDLIMGNPIKLLYSITMLLEGKL